MKERLERGVERYRVHKGPVASSRFDGMNGAFYISRPGSQLLAIIVSDGLGWEHASVVAYDYAKTGHPARCPTWQEMDDVKRMFWCDDETVMQLHVPREEHISYHPHCLHLWRPIEEHIPRPPSEMVAPAPITVTR